MAIYDEQSAYILKLRQRQKSFSDWLAEISPDLIWDLPHLILMRSYLNKIIAGEKIKIMFFLPPQHGKSTHNTIHFPAFYLTKNPKNKVIVGAYNQEFANSFSRKIRTLTERNILLSTERTAVTEWETSVGGYLKVVGVGGGITGYGADLIVIDDPIKNREEANSKIYRERIWNWWTDSISTRAHPKTSYIFTMTRWHQDDLAGRILENEKDWLVICLPALAESEKDLLGRKEGEALWPERYPKEYLLKQMEQSPATFQALYQQRPSAESGAIFQMEWWEYYKELPNVEFIIQSWDTAFKKKQENDRSVCTTWGITKNSYYLIDCWFERLEFPQLKRMVVNLYDKYKPHLILFEDAASGQSLIQELQNETRLPIKPVRPLTDKIARAHAITPIIEAKKVFLPERSSWLCDFLNEMLIFPNGAHDDIVDTVTQFLNYIRNEYITPSFRRL